MSVGQMLGLGTSGSSLPLFLITPCYHFDLTSYVSVLSALVTTYSLLFLQHIRLAPASGLLCPSYLSTWNTLPHFLHGSLPHFPGTFAQISPFQGHFS